MSSRLSYLKKHLSSIFAIVSILFCGLIFFSPSWSNPFVFDDVIKIQENPDLKSGTEIWDTLVYSYQSHTNHLRNDPSRPLVFIIYRLCFQAANGQTWPFHFVNTLVHCLNSIFIFLLVGLFASRLFLIYSVIPGLVSAFFFLFLPINANSVLYAYALSDILMTFFMLSALYLLSKNIKTSTLNFALIIFLFSCALLSKQSAVIFPALLIFTDLLFGIEIAKRRLHYITIFIITFLYLLGRYMFFGGIGDLEAVGQTFDQQDYLFVQGIMILKYLCLAVFPYGFAIDHTYLPQDFNALEKLMAWILILVPCSVSLFYVASKKSNVFVRLASWFCIFFVIALLPVSSFLPTVDLFVERRSYLSTIALVSMIGLFATLLLNTQKRNLRKLIVISFLTSILVLFSFITWNRTTLFGSPQNLWEEAFALYPQSKRIRVNLGTAYIDSNQLSEAKFLFESVAHDYPSDAFAFSSLGLIYQDTRFKGYNLRSALISYQRALELAPNDLVILYNFGVLMLGMGNLEKADSTFRQVLNLNPRFAYAMLGLGNTLIKNGNTVEGAKYLQDALKVDPQVPGAREQLLLLKK